MKDTMDKLGEIMIEACERDGNHKLAVRLRKYIEERGTKRHYIIAGSLHDYFHTIIDLELPPEKCVYISRPEQLYGLRNVKVIFGDRAHLSPARERAEMLNRVKK